jgi:hypothetical protein
MYNKNTIFICGCGHSGTTLLNKILGNHKNIYSMDYETGMFIRNTDKQISSILKTLDEKRIESNKKVLCEKTPGHVYCINKIYKLIESPKIIVMIRDGRDVVSSLYRRYGDLNISLDRWINDNTEWLSSLHKNKFHVIKYENLVTNPEVELKKICNYIEQEYDSNMLFYNKEKIELPKDIFQQNKIEGKNHSLLRQYQINQNLYDGSKRYLKDLNNIEMEFIMSNNEFMNLMIELEYII